MFSIQKQIIIYTLKILLLCKFSRNDLISLLIFPEASSASVPGEYLMLITFKLKVSNLLDIVRYKKQKKEVSEITKSDVS